MTGFEPTIRQGKDFRLVTHRLITFAVLVGSTISPAEIASAVSVGLRQVEDRGLWDALHRQGRRFTAVAS